MSKTDADFRVPTVVESKQVENSDSAPAGKVEDTSYETTEPKPSEYTQLNRQPLVVKLLENGEFSYDQFDIKAQTHEIDAFINSEITRLHLKDDKETYQKLVDKYLKQISATDIYTKVRELVYRIRIDRKIVEAAKEKDALMHADPVSLTSNQLLERFNLRRVGG